MDRMGNLDLGFVRRKAVSIILTTFIWLRPPCLCPPWSPHSMLTTTGEAMLGDFTAWLQILPVG